jgi:putative sigma-54 modulation protein
MTSRQTSPANIQFVHRHVEMPETSREYILGKLTDTISSIPSVKDASIEITFEDTAAEEDRYKMDITVKTEGSTLRVEERGPDVRAVTNTAYDVLERRARDWKERVYFERRKEGAEEKEAAFMERTSLPRDDKRGQIIRRKSFEIKPLFVEDAIEQMEALGHDFFFFLNGETQQYNVVYRRRDGGYGWIEPAIPEAGSN